MPIAAIFATIGAETVALTAAEVAAAEAAKIAAAEAAAAAAAETAAAAATQQAAQVAAQQAAQQAATQTAAQTATQAATGGAEALNLAAQQQAAQQAGIMGIEGATASQPLTAEAVQQAAMNQGVQITPLEGFPQDIAARRIPVNLTPDQIQAATGQSAGLADPSLAMQPQNTGFLNSPAVAPGPGPMQYQLNAPTSNQGMRLGSSLEGITAPTAQTTSVLQPPSALETGMDKAIKFAEKNPFTAMTGAYMGANALGLMDPSGGTFNDDKYDGPLSRIRLSPNFQGSTANPADFRYTPRYATGGGIMGANSYDIPVGYAQGEMVDAGVPEYARGGSLSDSIEQYQKMLEGEKQAAPARSADVGIYHDQDPDTRYQDPFTAAQIRQAKVNQRAYVSPPAAKRPTPLGQLKMPTSGKSKGGDDVEAAAGGMMRSYAGGGITGDGNLNLNIPLDIGGGGGGGYTPIGGGFNFGGGGGGNTSVFNGQNNTAGNNFGAPLGMDGRLALGSAPQQGGYGGIPPGFMPTNRGSSVNTTTTEDMMGGRRNSAVPFNQVMSQLGMANGGAVGYAMGGGISSLGGYAAGGNPRLLKGPGDGMSDNIPATINGRQPARLADGEFVIPADVVSHLGNGSTEAGAKQLHAMMNKIRKARTGNPKQGKQIKPSKFLPK